MRGPRSEGAAHTGSLGASRSALLVKFITAPDVKRVLFYFEGKDLAAVSPLLTALLPCQCPAARATSCLNQSQPARPTRPPHLHLPPQTLQPPTNFKKAAVYFLKLEQAALDPDNLADIVRRRTLRCAAGANRERPPFPPLHAQCAPAGCSLRCTPGASPEAAVSPQPAASPRPQVVSGELPPGDGPAAVLDHVSLLSSKVFLPLISANRARLGMPEVAARSVLAQLQSFVAAGGSERPWGARGGGQGRHWVGEAGCEEQRHEAAAAAAACGAP